MEPKFFINTVQANLSEKKSTAFSIKLNQVRPFHHTPVCTIQIFFEKIFASSDKYELRLSFLKRSKRER